MNFISFSIQNFSGGAGGKGVWGTPGQVYDVEEVDVKDPNYDDDQVSVFLLFQYTFKYLETLLVSCS